MLPCIGRFWGFTLKIDEVKCHFRWRSLLSFDDGHGVWITFWLHAMGSMFKSRENSDSHTQSPRKIVMHKSRNRANNVTKSWAIKIVASVNLICQGVGGIVPKSIPFSTTKLNTLCYSFLLIQIKRFRLCMFPPLKLDKKTSLIHSFTQVSPRTCAFAEWQNV